LILWYIFKQGSMFLKEKATHKGET